jgi:iron complex transport system permease protein
VITGKLRQSSQVGTHLGAPRPAGATPPRTLSPMSAQDTTGDPTLAAAPGRPARPAAGEVLLALVALLWMAGMLWSARASITGRAGAEMEVTSTAYALPGAVSAALVTGAATGLAVLALLRRRWTPGTTARFAVATGTGLTVGLLGALPIVTINTEGWIYAVVGGTIAAAGTLGGALAGFRLPRVVVAVCWAAVGVFLVGFVLNLFQDAVLRAFGSADSRQSWTTAAQWFSFSQSVLSGLAAGLISYGVLRRTRGAGPAPAWPWFALAGAGPGLLLVVGEGLTRTAGSRVLDLAGRVSTLDQTVQRMLSEARFNSALIVLFVGAITATVAIGRTIKPAPEPAAAPPAQTAGD